MEFKVIQDQESKITHRREIDVTISYASGSTPSRQDVANEAVKKLKVNRDLLVVKAIEGRTGNATAKIRLHVYEDKKYLPIFEPTYMIDKNKVPEAPKAEEAAQ
ncbi:MAG: ribosomal protein S24E [Candidatus Woesearchaeota archaeon]|jgi:ribosomal protein S24E